MSNSSMLKSIFIDVLELEETTDIDVLVYNSIPEWDSVAHMSLVSEIEDAFNIMLDTEDVLDMSSFSKAKEILTKYEISFG